MMRAITQRFHHLAHSPIARHRRVPVLLLAVALAAVPATSTGHAREPELEAEIFEMNLGQLDSARLNGELDALGATEIGQAPDARDELALPSGVLLHRVGGTPGVGFAAPEGSIACWEGGQDAGCYQMDLSALPWGPTGNGPLDTEAFEARYFGGNEHEGGSWPQGMAAELLWPANQTVLIAAYEGSCTQISVQAEGRDGDPTWQEVYDLATTTDRCSPVYYECWWATKAGGSRETAIEATEHQMRTWEICESGMIRRASSVCQWPIWYQVDPPPDAAWCESQTEEPDPPAEPDPPSEPDPPAEPDPPELPECAGACQQLTERLEQALSGPRRSILPDGSGAPDSDGRYQFIPGWLRPSLERLMDECATETGCVHPVEEETSPGQ
ncbi:MAG: hypothetical protein PVG07_03505 [Acidobacteriota bacterium]